MKISPPVLLVLCALALSACMVEEDGRRRPPVRSSVAGSGAPTAADGGWDSAPELAGEGAAPFNPMRPRSVTNGDPEPVVVRRTVHVDPLVPPPLQAPPAGVPPPDAPPPDAPPPNPTLADGALPRPPPMSAEPYPAYPPAVWPPAVWPPESPPVAPLPQPAHPVAAHPAAAHPQAPLPPVPPPSLAPSLSEGSRPSLEGPAPSSGLSVPAPLLPGAKAPGASASDPLYFSFLGKELPDLAPDGVWLTPGISKTLSGLRGQVIYLQFAFQSCPSCGLSTPYLQQWQQSYGPQGLSIVYVNNGLMANQEAAQKAILEEKLLFPYFHDPKGESLRIYGVRAFPTAYVVDRSGKVIWEGTPTANEPRIGELIQSLLLEK